MPFLRKYRTPVWIALNLFFFSISSGPALGNKTSPISAERPSDQSSQRVAADTVDVTFASDLIRLVIESNKTIHSLETAADAVSERTGYVGAYPDPIVMLTGQPLPVYTARGKQILGLRVEQMIPYPGKQSLMREMARLDSEMGYTNVQTAAVGAILEAQLALNDVRRAEARREVIYSFEERLDGYEKLALRKYEVGEGSQQSILKIQLERARLEQSLLDFDRTIQANRLVIERWVQQPVRILQTEQFGLRDETPSLDLASRSELQVLAQSIELNGTQTKLIDFYNRPDFGVSLNWLMIAKSDIPASSDGRDALGVGISVKIPLAQSANRSKRQESQLQRQAIEEQIESTKQSIQALYDELEAKTDFDQKSIDHIDKSLLPSVLALLETSVSSYSNGKGDFLDLLDAERTGFQLENERIEIAARLRAGQLMLDRVSGHLNRQVAELF
ncbi:MAG: TolC family protein [Bacteroidetes bacterium]|nr:TolC family protein [Bacteroidota bacterium]